MGRVRETEQHIGKSGFVIFAQIDHATIAITLDTYSRLVPGMGD